MASKAEEDQELEDAEVEFSEDKQREAENNMQILTALGFTPHYHDKDKEGNDETNFGIRILNTKIGVKFNPENPTGKVWAYILTDDNKKDFIKNGDLKTLPLVQRYLDIQAGKKPIPEPTVRGRIIERRPKSVLIEIEEDGEKKEIIFGWGAVKKHEDGHHFIPHGFSKPSKDNPEGKMYVPRDILLPEMNPQPTTTNRADAEVQRIRRERDIYKSPQVEEEQKALMAQRKREAQRAPAATTILVPAQPPVAKPTVKGNLTVPELITKYREILAQVIIAVDADGRIPNQERGYAYKFLFYSVKHALENGKGGDQEEA